MKPEIKSISVITINDEVPFRDYIPANLDDFNVTLRLYAGPEGLEGEESFDIIICTPKWLLANNIDNDVIIARHHMIVFKYDYARIRSAIESFLKKCSGKDWNECALKLSRLGFWEFEDY